MSTTGTDFRDIINCLHIKERIALLSLQVKEGRLPEEDLIFHLNLSEIHELLETRAPKYLIRARHRRTNQKTAALAIFPEHCAGRPIKCVRNIAA